MVLDSHTSRYGHTARYGAAALAMALVVALLVLAAGCAGSGNAAEGRDPTRSSAFWFAEADGTTTVGVVGTAEPGSSALAALRALDTMPVPPPAEAFVTRPAAGGRQIAYDAAHERLWYSDDHARIASIDLVSGAPGPTLGPFSDIALWGCAVGGRARTFAVDQERNRLLVSSLGGGLLGYDLDTLELSGGIGPGVLGDVAFDFRRIAIDEASDTLWFSTAAGTVAGLDLDRQRLTGAVVDTDGTPLALTIDSDGGRLLWLASDRLGVTDLDTLERADEPAPAGAVAFTWVAGR